MKEIFFNKALIITAVAFTAPLIPCNAQGIASDSVASYSRNWNFEQCLEYARNNNIQLQQTQLTKEQGLVSLEAAKAQWFPTLNASSTQGFTNYPRPQDGMKANQYTGSYGINAGWTLYDGGNRSNSIKRAELDDKINDLAIEEIYDNLETSVLTYYLEIAYAKEAITIAEKSLEVSKTQMERAEQLTKAGKMSRVDFAQLQSQYHSDMYAVVSAKSNYDNKVSNMKRLLELNINEDMTFAPVSFSDQDVLQPLAQKGDIFNIAQSWMPGFKSNKLKSEANDLDIKIAESGMKPKVSLNGSVGTMNASGTGYNFGDQLLNSLNEHVGVTLSVPILDNKQTKTAVAKAKIEKLNTELSYRDLENSLAQSIETTFIEARNNQAKYVSGKEQLKSAELTDELTNEQFRLGLVNTLDLLTSHNKLQNARQELLQSKYMAILSIKMLDYYQHKGITLP